MAKGKNKKGGSEYSGPSERLRSPALSLRKKLLYSALASILFLALLELILALVGIEPAYRTGDPLVGFSKQLPHFVETEDGAGNVVMVTAPGKDALNSQRFLKRKPADTFRIVCLGGSTTYGRPFWDETSFGGWLRAYLPAADSSRTWEVINAGGISYASYRVLAVEEELSKYEPDLFIFYVGHNEFLERRTYGDLLDQPELLKSMRASAYRLRTATLIQRIADGISKRDQEKPIVMGEEVKRIPIDAVGPEAYARDDAFQEEVVTHFRLSLDRMLTVAEQCGAKVILVSPASNYQHATPFKSEHTVGLNPASLDSWRTTYGEGIHALNSGDFPTALTRLRDCLEIDPRHASTHYHLGRTLAALGRHQEARTAFARAIEEDVCPLRAIPATLTVLRDTAASHDLPLIDFQAALEARSEHGITGDQFFHDHLHPTIEANRLLALELLARMEERSWISPQWTAQEQEAVASRVTTSLDHGRHARELCKLSYAMDAFQQEHMALATVQEAVNLAPHDGQVLKYALPFYSKRNLFAPIINLLERQTSKAPQDRRALANLAQAYSKVQRFEEAADTYQRLLAQSPNDVSVLQHLAVARSKAGDHDRAEKHIRQAAELDPQSPNIQNNLGLILASGGQHELAIQHFREAVELQPSLSSAHYNWGLSLAQLNRRHEAIEKFRRVLELQPGHQGATKRLRSGRED